MISPSTLTPVIPPVSSPNPFLPSALSLALSSNSPSPTPFNPNCNDKSKCSVDLFGVNNYFNPFSGHLNNNKNNSNNNIIFVNNSINNSSNNNIANNNNDYSCPSSSIVVNYPSIVSDRRLLPTQSATFAELSSRSNQSLSSGSANQSLSSASALDSNPAFYSSRTSSAAPSSFPANGDNENDKINDKPMDLGNLGNTYTVVSP